MIRAVYPQETPNWLILLAALYVAVLVSYAVFDNRTVELLPPKIYAKDESSGPASSKAAGLPWVSIDWVTPTFPIADCRVQVPAALSLAQATNVQQTTWGGEGGLLWFGNLRGNTVWLACHETALLIIVGAAGPEPSSSKNAVDSLVSEISK